MTTENAPLYPNQPLVEVATEIRFSGNLAVEVRRHEFQTQIKEKYPILLLPAAMSGVAPTLQHYRFETEGRLAGVQLAVNSFSHYSRQYPGALSFIREALALFHLARDLIGDIGITRVGWRYINAIPFIRENEELPLSRYFADQSLFGTALHHEFIDVSLEGLAVVGDARQRIKLSTGRSKGSEEEEAIFLDIDTFIRKEDGGDILTADVDHLINRLHDLGRSAFEGMITEPYRQFLKGGTDESI